MTNPQSDSNLQVHEEVREALAADVPVLALESTIITHGMPFPKNLEMALDVQEIVRKKGVMPATVAIIEGQLKVGLDSAEIEMLARQGPAITKCSRRDIPFLLNSGTSGATTVAATMIVAEMAGIRIFATGGIGGVHRGAETSMDISADLLELAKTNVAVVCAGPKSILDIGLTLEYLETHGVPVIGYRCDELPAFYTRKSGFDVDYRLDSVEDIAALLRTKWSLGLDGGMVIANPIPEEAELDFLSIEQFIAQGIEEAEKQEIGGKNLTPFLLRRIEEQSGGASLQANTRLMLNNAKLGAEIAAAFAGQS